MKRCFAVSEIIRTPPFDETTRKRILGLIGSMAEAVIGKDYLTKEVKRPAWYPLPPALDFHDVHVGLASRTLYVAFICDRNPGVDRTRVERLATERGIPGPDGQLLCIPDFMSHGPPQMFRFYEVKPDSQSGEKDGEEKMAFVRAFMQELDLSYVPGDTWKAGNSYQLFRGTIFGLSVTVTFEYKRHGRIKGLVVYHFCIDVSGPRLRPVPVWVLLLILLIVIIAVLFPELIPVLVPVLA